MIFPSNLYFTDPFGILEPEEIYFHASRCIKANPLLDPFPNLLVGPVLVTVSKVKDFQIPNLHLD